jgi:hypothetical protein
MLVDDVIARLTAIPELVEVSGVAELGALMQGGRPPNRMPAAFVVPLGLRAGPPDAVAGLYRQRQIETIGVVIVVATAGDARGAVGSGKVVALRDAVIAALAGWGPTGGFGVLELVRADLVSVAAGTIVYQTDFSIPDQLRIAR